MVKVIKWHPATIRNRTNIETTKKGKTKTKKYTTELLVWD